MGSVYVVFAMVFNMPWRCFHFDVYFPARFSHQWPDKLWLFPVRGMTNRDLMSPQYRPVSPHSVTWSGLGTLCPRRPDPQAALPVRRVFW